MLEESNLRELSVIDLKIAERLRDPDFRREWFRAELEASVPEQFKALRERRGMRQGDLARAVGTKQPAICRFEKSTEANWEFANLLRMAEALDARLRLVIEAAEDVVPDYDNALARRSGASSALEKLGSETLQQRRGASALDSLGNKNEADQYRGEPRGVAGAPQTDQGSAIRTRRVERHHPTI